MTREYPEPSPGDGFHFVREWSDERLEQEFYYLSGLYGSVLGEMAFRADNPEQRDDTGGITATHVMLYNMKNEGERTLVERGENDDPGQ